MKEAKVDKPRARKTTPLTSRSGSSACPPGHSQFDAAAITGRAKRVSAATPLDPRKVQKMDGKAC